MIDEQNGIEFYSVLLVMLWTYPVNFLDMLIFLCYNIFRKIGRSVGFVGKAVKILVIYKTGGFKSERKQSNNNNNDF